MTTNNNQISTNELVRKSIANIETLNEQLTKIENALNEIKPKQGDISLKFARKLRYTLNNIEGVKSQIETIYELIVEITNNDDDSSVEE